MSLAIIIILNYNGARWLKACLESVLATNYENFKVLLVDNASDDGSVDLARRLFPRIEIIVNPSNLGFSEGNNVGIRRALQNRADYIVLLNPDTKVEPDWLRHLIETGERNQQVGILGAAQLSYDGDGFNSWTEAALKSHLDELKNPEQARELISVEWVEGACLAVKRKVFEEVGLLDPVYFAFYEEIDFCRRANCRGYEIALVPPSRIRHYRGGSWQANPTIERERDYRCDRSQFIYNSTDPRKTLSGNFGMYLVTLATKGKETLLKFSLSRAWDLARMQFDLLVNLNKLIDKWRREREQWRRAIRA